MLEPKIRDGQREAVVYAFNTWLKDHGQDLMTTCITCVNFNEHREGCKLANYQRPPARVIAYGCPSYFHDDEIPF